jgi:hypothetical protein
MNERHYNGSRALGASLSGERLTVVVLMMNAGGHGLGGIDEERKSFEWS